MASVSREWNEIDLDWDAPDCCDECDMSPLDGVRGVLNRERLQTASELRDLARRIGVAASPEWVRGQLEEVANKLESWATQ